MRASCYRLSAGSVAWGYLDRPYPDDTNAKLVCPPSSAAWSQKSRTCDLHRRTGPAAFYRALASDAADIISYLMIHNICPRLKSPLVSFVGIFASAEDRFRFPSLTNFSPNRGVDRIVDVAEILHRRGDRRFAFYLCGRPAHTHAITGRADLLITIRR